MNFHFINWQKFEEMAEELAYVLHQKGCKAEIIVAISRGGLVLARILSDFLKLPIYNIAIESYSEIGKNKEPVITQDLGSADIAGKNILLVDEICDTGKTFERAVGYLSGVVGEGLTTLPMGQVVRPVPTDDHKTSIITTACLVLKSHSSFAPDFFVEKIDKWVIFPYEIRETVESLRDKMNKEQIIELGLPEKLVNKFLPIKK